MTYNPPKNDSRESYDHLYTLQSYHGAVVAPLSEVSQEDSAGFSLFPPIKLHLASHPLASSYCLVMVSSKEWCIIKLFLFVHVDWAPLKQKNIFERVVLP